MVNICHRIRLEIVDKFICVCRRSVWAGQRTHMARSGCGLPWWQWGHKAALATRPKGQCGFGVAWVEGLQWQRGSLQQHRLGRVVILHQNFSVII